MTTARLVIWLVLLAFAGRLPAAEETNKKASEPTQKKPTSLLAVREHAESIKLQAAAEKAYTEALAMIEDIVAKRDKGNWKAIKPEIVGDAMCRTRQIELLGVRLEKLGEPAGAELIIRARPLDDQLARVMSGWRPQPGAGPILGKLFDELQKQAEKEKGNLTKAEKLTLQDKWEEAENMVLRSYYSLHRVGVWNDPQKRPYGVFELALKKLDKEVEPIVLQRGVDQAAEDRLARRPDFTALVDEVKKATTAVGASGQAQVDNENLPGPAVFARFAQKWRAAHLNAQRRQALDWAAYFMKEPNADAGKLLDDQHAFHAAMAVAMAGLIEAESLRAAPAEAETIYPQYVQEAAALVSLVDLKPDATLSTDLSKALEKLAARSPALAADVAAYHAATDDLLRWRQRTAQAQAQRLADYPEMEKQFWTVAGDKGDKLGIRPVKGDVTRQGVHLVKSAPEIIELATAPLLNKNITVAGVSGPRGEGKLKFSPLFGATFARVPHDDKLAAATTELAADLLVSDTAPPLTLAAALAVHTAKQGDLEQAGGEIVGLGLNAFVPRFVNLPDEEHGFVRLAPLQVPPPGTEQDYGLRVMVRFDVKPAWAQHAYFFVELPAPSGS